MAIKNFSFHTAAFNPEKAKFSQILSLGFLWKNIFFFAVGKIQRETDSNISFYNSCLLPQAESKFVSCKERKKHKSAHAKTYIQGCSRENREQRAKKHVACWIFYLQLDSHSRTLVRCRLRTLLPRHLCSGVLLTWDILHNACARESCDIHLERVDLTLGGSGV